MSIFTYHKDTDISILLNLGKKDLYNLSLTCHYFNNLIKSNDFWLRKLLKDFPKRYKTFHSNDKCISAYRIYKIIDRKSKLLTFDEKQLPKTFKLKYYEEIQENLSVLTEEIKSFVFSKSILRGDVIYLEWIEAYRNNGKFIWDGEKVVNLSYEYDNYGNVPKEFSFPEFEPKHFYHSIVHNTILCITDEKVKEIILNFSKYYQKTYITDFYNTYTINTPYISEKQFGQIVKNYIENYKQMSNQYYIGV